MKTDNAEFDPEDLNLITLAQEYSDEDRARALLESLRWPNGPVCPHCNFTEVYKLVPGKGSKMRAGVYKCAACREQFTVTVGTIFEDSHLPISKWLMAIHILCASKKAVSAHQLHRMLKVTYKTAWFLAHRIRHAMGDTMPLGKMLAGTVEVDETYVGGKPDNRRKPRRKTPVVVLVERDGDAHTRVVPSVTQKNLRPAFNECVEKGAIVNTDDAGVYRKMLKGYARHDVVNHSKEEYARANADGSTAHVNTAESFFSLFKRGIYGSWHHISEKHMPKYADEFAFRWSKRKITDGERTVAAIKATEGKRLYYRRPANTSA